jgi:hypothetical protein
MTADHKPGCEALGGYGNGVGACACTPDKQAAPSEWVERAMEVADDLADVARADEDQRPAMEALRAHLECKEREHLATKALVKQLAEALTECVEDSQELVNAYVQTFGENFRPARLKGMRDQVNKARAALAAQQRYVALQEKT